MAPPEFRIARPGFGLPINHEPPHAFPHAIGDYVVSVGITLRERRMLDFITQISDKPDWDRKVLDQEIVAKWKSEACRFDEGCQDDFLSEPMFEYCIAELREKALIHQEKGFITVMDFEAAVAKSDSAVAESLRHSLMQAVRPLEDVPDRLKDWHPGSNQIVLDLVHPSLFPIVYGRSRALPFGRVSLEDCARYCGAGEVISELPPDLSEISIGFHESSLEPWGNYQWLPSQVNFLPDGRPKISSYVNNLHPQHHPKLYSILEEMVDRSIPLWNECLSWSEGSRRRIRIVVDRGSDEDWIIPEGVKWARPEVDDDPSGAEENDKDWADMHGFWDQYNDWWEQHRVLKQPEPLEFKYFSGGPKASEKQAIDLRSDYKESGLQIIFKLANIHLTPENPEYNSSNWHVEGALNEHICATAIYYYDSENIGPSHLAFRQSIDSEDMIMRPEQNEYSSTCAYFGIENEGAAIQNLGKVSTHQGRLLTFPNIMQHQVQPFRLADPTKPGHRKILAMFLVDPHIPILSTANVPPQRKDWWAKEVQKVERFASLPVELFENIINFVEDFPISWEDALEIRERLMEERGRIADEVNEAMEENMFSFCEH